MDGFRVANNFLCKELAWIDLATMKVDVEYFRVADISFNRLPINDQKTVSFVSRFVHGLRFHDTPGDAPQYRIGNILMRLSKDAIYRGGVIAYKGGVEEKKWCQRLGIENVVNIEESPFNCPTFRILREQLLAMSSNNDKIKRFNDLQCYRHGRISPDVIMHCSAQEVYLFALFITKVINYEGTRALSEDDPNV